MLIMITHHPHPTTTTTTETAIVLHYLRQGASCVCAMFAIKMRKQQKTTAEWTHKNGQ